MLSVINRLLAAINLHLLLLTLCRPGQHLTLDNNSWKLLLEKTSNLFQLYNRDIIQLLLYEVVRTLYR
jgi:hypothetical protein